MKTIKTGINFIKRYYNSGPYDPNLSKDKINSELDEFKQSIENKPTIEQQELFYNKFGQLIKIDILIKKNKLLQSIKGILSFFQVIVIIWIIILGLVFLGTLTAL